MGKRFVEAPEDFRILVSMEEGRESVAIFIGNGEGVPPLHNGHRHLCAMREGNGYFFMAEGNKKPSRAAKRFIEFTHLFLQGGSGLNKTEMATLIEEANAALKLFEPANKI